MKTLGFGHGMIAAVMVFAASACSPRVFVIDRHTVLEEEAAGEWPDFEKDLLLKSSERGVVPYGATKVTEEQKKLYNILNGEVSASK